MLNLIADEEITPMPVEKLVPCGGRGLEENRESSIYEFVVRRLPNEASYRDYLRTEMEKLEDTFEVEYKAYLQCQNHPGSFKLSAAGRPTQQLEVTSMVESRNAGTGILSRPAVLTIEPGQSYGPTGDTESEPGAPVFIYNDLMSGEEFNWVSFLHYTLHEQASCAPYTDLECIG